MDQESDLEPKVGISLTAIERQAIDTYLLSVEELKKTKLLSTGKTKISTRFEYSRRKPPSFTVSLPPEDILRSFLMAFRLFYLEDEQTNFLRIANLVRRGTKQPIIKSQVDSLRQRWLDALGGRGIDLYVNGRRITLRVLIDLWFNAHYFHGAEGKHSQLSILTKVLGYDFAKFLLVDGVYEATKAVLSLGELLRTLDTASD